MTLTYTTTYTRTITGNKLVISYDNNPISPREDDNLGLFITINSKYPSIDNDKDLQDILMSTADICKGQEAHMALFLKEAQAMLKIPIVFISPIYRFEHSEIHYSMKLIGNRFETNLLGFVIVTKDNLKKLGIKKIDIERQLETELDQYNKYANNQVYQFLLHDDDGEVIDSCSGFYDLDDIKEHLPQEYKDIDLEQFIECNN